MEKNLNKNISSYINSGKVISINQIEGINEKHPRDILAYCVYKISKELGTPLKLRTSGVKIYQNQENLGEILEEMNVDIVSFDIEAELLRDILLKVFGEKNNKYLIQNVELKINIVKAESDLKENEDYIDYNLDDYSKYNSITELNDVECKIDNYKGVLRIIETDMDTMIQNSMYLRERCKNGMYKDFLYTMIEDIKQKRKILKRLKNK